MYKTYNKADTIDQARVFVRRHLGICRTSLNLELLLLFFMHIHQKTSLTHSLFVSSLHPLSLDVDVCCRAAPISIRHQVAGMTSLTVRGSNFRPHSPNCGCGSAGCGCNNLGYMWPKKGRLRIPGVDSPICCPSHRSVV